METNKAQLWNQFIEPNLIELVFSGRVIFFLSTVSRLFFNSREAK